MSTEQSIARFSLCLDNEWDRLRVSRRCLRHVKSWAADDAPPAFTRVVAEVSDLDELISATQRGVQPAGSDDTILLRLVEMSRHDQLAGRIVIQRILPGLISRAIRYRSFHDGIDPTEIVVATAWIAIRSFDVDRRGRHVAAALISDAVYQAFRQPLRRRSSAEVAMAPGSFHRLIAEQPTHPIVELADVIRDAHAAGVPDRDIDLLRQLARTESPRLVARDRHITDRTIRTHRARAVARVRAALAA